MTAFETGKVKPPDLPRLGHPVTAISPEMLQRDAIVCEDGRSTTQQLALSLLILKGNVNHIIQNRGYWKACIRWVPRGITFDQKITRKTISFELTACLKLKERPYATLLQQMKPGCILNQRRTHLAHVLVFN